MAREPTGDGHHVLLGDAALEEALGVRLLEAAHPAVGREVGVEHDERRIPGGQLDERLSVGLDDVLAADRDACPRTALGLRLERRCRQLVLYGGHRLELDGPDSVEQLVTSALEALVVGCARVPAVGAAIRTKSGRMLHERHATALDRASDEHLRAVRDRAELPERAPQLAVVVAVAGRNVPAKPSKLRLEISEREDLLRRPVRLKLVAVDDNGQARQAVVSRTLQGLEVLTLLQLAVTNHDYYPPAPAELPLRPGDAAAFGDAHAERAGVRLDARRPHVRMPVQPT